MENSLNEFIRFYLDRGFGSMNKNDFEVWIFNYLLHNQLLGKSDYEISIYLRMPESKIRRMRYEAALKYPDERNYAKEFDKVLHRVKFRKGSSTMIQFVIEDTSLRKYIDNMLKKDGRYSVSSFNTEIVKLDIDDLEYLLQELYGKEYVESILKKASKALEKEHVTFRELFDEFAKAAAKNIGENFVDISKVGLSGLKLLLL